MRSTMLLLLRQIHAAMVTAYTQNASLKPTIDDLSSKLELTHKGKKLMRQLI